MCTYMPKVFLPCALCFVLLSGGLSLSPPAQAVQAVQAAPDAALMGTLYAEREDDYSHSRTKNYQDNKRYKKNDSSRLHDNRDHEMNLKGNMGRGKSTNRDDRYDRDDRNRKYDRDDRTHKYDSNDRDNRYDGKRGDRYDRNHNYDSDRDGRNNRDVRDRIQDDIRDSVRDVIRGGDRAH